VATLCHESDGEQPTKIYSVGASGDAGGRLEPSTLDQLLEGCVPQAAKGAAAGVLEQTEVGAPGALQLQALTNALMAAAQA
jgi:hypothetical protein